MPGWWWNRLRHRLRQTWRALWARPRPRDLAAARQVLGPRLWALFARQARADQAHALEVWQRVRAAGGDRVAQQAALLHDVGKARVSLRLWQRIAAVLGRACCPARARAWGQGPPRGWRTAFVVAEQHPAWGAAWARQAGADEAVALLIAHHHDPAPTALPPRLHTAWALLKAADEDQPLPPPPRA